jgi:hypothetical protein
MESLASDFVWRYARLALWAVSRPQNQEIARPTAGLIGVEPQ